MLDINAFGSDHFYVFNKKFLALNILLIPRQLMDLQPRRLYSFPVK